MTTPPLQERLLSLLFPAFLLYYAIRSFIVVTLTTLTNPSFDSITSIRSTAFAKFWNTISPATPIDPSAPEPELQGSAALIPPLLATASGVVLELGPGNGSQVRYLDSSKVARIYGAEPVHALHPVIRESAARVGLDGKYIVVDAGTENDTLIPGLERAGVFDAEADASGSGSGSGKKYGAVFDTIILVRVLCSVDDVADTVKTLYALLKPGGKLLVCEHVKNPWREGGSVVARIMQSVYMMMGWWYFVGNCHLTRNTGRDLVGSVGKMGGWERDELRTSFGWAPMCYLSGTLVKPGGGG